LYIGQTLGTIHRRWVNHKAASRKEVKRKVNLAIVEYGPEAFTIEEIACVPGEWLNFVETSYIVMYDSMNNGYNMRMDGSRISPEVRKRMSEAQKGRPSKRKGMKQPPEAVEAQRLQMLGRKASDETKAKMSAAHIARYQANPALRIITEEHKEKLRVVNTGLKQSAETIEKRMVQIRGRKCSDESRARMSAAQKGIKKPQKPEHLEIRRIAREKAVATRKANKLKRQEAPNFN
jgi:group I intron endonuclease